MRCVSVGSAITMPKHSLKNTLASKSLSITKLSSLTDKSTTHVAEMMLLGSFMGVIQCIKDLNDHSSADEEIINLCKKIQDAQEKNIEKLKNFL